MLILLLIVVSIISIRNVAKLDADIADIKNDKFPKVLWASDIATQLNVSARAIRNAALADSRVLKDKELERLVEVRRVADDRIAKLQANIRSEAGKAILKKLIDARDRYRVVQAKAIEAARESKNGAELRELLFGEMRLAQSEYLALCDELIAFQSKTLDGVAKSADELAINTTWIVSAFGVLSVVIGLALGFLISRKLAQQLGGEPGEVAEAVGRVANGDLQTDVVLRPGDNSSLAHSLQVMVVNLRERTERERKAASETLRVKTALDGAEVAMTVSDDHGVLVYMNDAAKALWLRMEVEIARVHPGFSVSRMIGDKLSNYIEEPSVRSAFQQPLVSRQVYDLKLGGRDLRIVAMPVRDPEGAMIGRVSQWNDRTEELQVENEVAAIIQAAAAGDFAPRVDLRDKNGFFLQVATGINQLLDANSHAIEDVAAMFGRLAKGDLTRGIDADYQGMLGKLKADANATVENLHTIVGSIKHATEAIRVAAREIASGNTDLSSRTEEQASSLEETASSMEQLTSTVKLNAENANHANQLASQAQTVATKGGDVVQEVVRTMGAIHQSSSKIADIIGVIDGIAFQTNILALNAAVEAARAGEQGRGFAVVATEVRNLAQRSAGAAKEIKGLISDSVAKVEDGNRLAESAGKTMEDVVGSIGRVARIVTEIAEASQEQSSGIDQVSQAVSQMDEVTQQNAALVEEAAAAAESLDEQAEQLATAVAVFRLGNEGRGKPAAHAHRALAAPPKRERAAPAQSAVPESLDDEWQEF